MAVWKSSARLLGADQTLAGEGRAYVHLPQDATQPQPVQGTMSLDWWDEAATPTAVELQEGPLLVIQLSSDRLSSCVVGRVLRYSGQWPGHPAAATT